MKSWLLYLKNGLARGRSRDRFAAATASAEQTVQELYRRFIPFLIKFRMRFVAGIGLVFLTAAASLPLPFIGRFLIDDVIINRQLPLLVWTVLAIIGLAVAGRLLDLYLQYYFDRLNREVVLDIQSGLLDRVFHYSKTFFDRTRTGYLMNRLEEDVHGIGWFFSGTMAVMIENIFRFLGGLIFLLYLDWRLTIIVGIILPGVVIMVRYFSEKLRTLSNESMETQAIVTGNFQESLSSITLIKAFAAEGKTLQQLREALRNALNISIEQSTVNALANMAITSLPEIARAAVLFIGAYWVIIGHWTLGSLFAYQAYLAYVFGPAQFLATANLEMQSALASANRIANLFDIVPEENTGQGKIVTRLAGNIEFKQVRFAYDADAPILDDINFSIRAGERIAIVGASGDGKTTLISLILRLYKPTAGEIFFDSHPASDYDVGSLRERIGYVPQQNWLLAGTIMDNIIYGNPAAGTSEAIEAAKNAGIHDFIATLPEGYQTEVGERGVALSEGQKQRICIARAFLKDPDIILMDEPTSALDGRTGRSLLLSLPLMLKGKTVLIVSNHLGLLTGADRVFLLRGNRLEAIGAHEELMSQNPYYASLVIGGLRVLSSNLDTL
ncbi:MAG: ABC transporter ATP-binding protein [Deltaproteobacteria bacterium]